MPQPPPPITWVKAWLADWDLPARLRVRRVSGGFTSHAWHLESNENSWLAKLAYQPPGDVENGLRGAAAVAKSRLNTGLPVLTRDGELTRLVEYPIRQFHALAVLRFVEGQLLQNQEANMQSDPWLVSDPRAARQEGAPVHMARALSRQ